MWQVATVVQVSLWQIATVVHVSQCQIATVVQVLPWHVVCIAVVTVRHGTNLPIYPTFQMHTTNSLALYRIDRFLHSIPILVSHYTVSHTFYILLAHSHSSTVSP